MGINWRHPFFLALLFWAFIVVFLKSAFGQDQYTITLDTNSPTDMNALSNTLAPFEPDAPELPFELPNLPDELARRRALAIKAIDKSLVAATSGQWTESATMLKNAFGCLENMRTHLNQMYLASLAESQLAAANEKERLQNELAAIAEMEFEAKQEAERAMRMLA